jgi:hypothetical protein
MEKQRRRRNLKASGGDTTYYDVEVLTEKVMLLVHLPLLRADHTRSNWRGPFGVARAALRELIVCVLGGLVLTSRRILPRPFQSPGFCF